MIYKQVIMASMSYPLGLSTLTEAQWDKIQYPELCTKMKKIGLSSKTSCSIVHGLPRYDELNLTNLYTVSGNQKK